MYAYEFKTIVKDKYIELQNIDKLMNKQVRVIVLVDKENSLSDDVSSDKFSNNICFNELNNISAKTDVAVNNTDLIQDVFKEAVKLKINNEIDINSLCNEVNR